MTASDYQIFFPYGATSTPYTDAHPHRGDDRACPEGTPVVINGVEIGLTGQTGKAIGPHLHIQEWQNDYAATRKPQNAFQPGTVTNIDPSGTQGDGSFGKFITIQTADGWNDSYCHLSQINVSVGQVIGGSVQNTPADYNFARELSETVLLRSTPMSEDEYNQYHQGKTQLEIYSQFANSDEAGTKRNEFFFDYPKLKEEVGTLEAQVSALQASQPAGAIGVPTPPDPNQVTVTKDGLWASFKKFFGL